MSGPKKYRGRIAPTPSGFLHMGHASTFREAWRRAREAGGELILRMEDIDSARTRPEYVAQIYKDLKKIGLDWDEGPDVGGPCAPYQQSERADLHWEALELLRSKNLVYPCSASRAQIMEHSPKPGRKMEGCGRETVFPTELRPKKFDNPKNPRRINWRFRVPDGRTVGFSDGIMGDFQFSAGEDFGDFLVWRKSGGPSYELAVVADDIAMGVTEVVRGRDLLLSTARQLLLYEALGSPPPSFAHCPLLTQNGEKLSKSVLKNDGGNPFLIKNS